MTGATGEGSEGETGDAAGGCTTIHSNISYHIAASGGAHTPQREARPVMALYPMPAGAVESVSLALTYISAGLGSNFHSTGNRAS